MKQHTFEELHDQDKVIAVNFFGSLSADEVQKGIEAAGAVVVPEKIQPPNVLFIRAGNAGVLEKLAALPYVSYIASQPMKPRSLNYNNRGAHGASALGATAGRDLQGDGIAVGIGDNSSPYTHIDFFRQADRSLFSTVDAHGTFTCAR